MEPAEAEKIDLAIADVYVDHLAELSQFIEVIATEDIYNEFGVLLIPKGERIKKSVSERLSGHKMQKPVDDVMSLGNILNCNQLYADILDSINQLSDLQKIHTHSNFDNKLKHLCTVKSIPRQLLQKLTVLKERLPDVYRRSLFSAWFGSMLANKMSLELNQIYNTFLVGIFHDLGMLHIPASLSSQISDFSERDWQLIEAHVMISQQVVDNAHLYPDEVKRGILEHHERCDGTGYPRELSYDKLSIIGQIIALSNTIYNIRIREFKQLGKNMLDFKPYLQVNTQTYFFETYKAAYAIITQSELPSSNLIDQLNFTNTISSLLIRNREIQQLIILLVEQLKLLKTIKTNTPNSIKKIGNSVISSLHNIMRTIERSGIIGEGVEQWFESITDDDYESAHHDLQEIESMQQELLWLTKKAARLMPNMMKEELVNNTTENSEAQKLADEIALQLECCWNTYK